MPFVICKGRKGLIILNLNTFTSYELFSNEEMQANSFWEKMILCYPPKKMVAGVGSFLLTFAVWRE